MQDGVNGEMKVERKSRYLTSDWKRALSDGISFRAQKRDEVMVSAGIGGNCGEE